MTKKNKGFTLVELLGVITILAIVVIIASTSVMSLVKKAREGTAKEMRKNLEEVAITYAIDELKLAKCSDNVNVNDTNFAANSTCAKKITVATLKSEGLFEDSSNHCLNTDYVIVYRYSDGVNSEYKTYINDNVCKN